MSERKRPENNIEDNDNMPPAKKIHRTRQFFYLGLDAHLEQLAIEQARALRKRGQRFQVEYNYFIENNKKRSETTKKIVRTERLFTKKREQLENNEPGSLEKILANNLLNYTDEERSRVKLTNVSIIPMITDLVPVESMFQFMNRFVLEPEWFRYANAIAPVSLQENDNNCVAFGVTQILLNPIRGRPMKYLPNPWGKTTLESVTAFLDHLKMQGKEPDFAGYSSSCLHKFLKKMQINHYAFNAENKNFLVCTDFDSHNFAPIIWLTHNGHCYFVTSKEAVKSVAEAAKQIKSAAPRKSEQKELPNPESLRFFEGEIEEAISRGLDNWEPGIYLCNQPDLQEAYELYVSVTRNEGLRPIQIDRNERVSEFSVKTKKGKITFVANPDEGITDAPDLKRAADNAGLTFRGQSLAKLINDILNAPHCRCCLTIEQKDEIVVNQKGKCAGCGEKLVKKKIEFDHKQALANGGTNAVENFQALCPSCHQDKTSHELHTGYTFRSSFASILHPQMQLEMQEPESLSYARVEFVGKLQWIPNPDRQIDQNRPALDDYVIEHPDLAEIDMEKCRRHLLGGYHRSATGKYFDWPVYSGTDLPRPYSGELQCGMFYVETTLDLGPFRGNGWYFECSCIWVLDRGLITQEDIKLEWIPSRSVPHDHFRPIIQQLLDAFAFDKDLQKRGPNYFVGMCNKMKRSARSVKFSLSPDQAGTWLAREDFSFVKKLDLQCGTGLYMGTFVSEFTSDTSCRPIYQMIVQMESIEVENLHTTVQQWASPYALKTDAVQFEEPGQVEVWEMQDWARQQFWNEERTIPKYRYEVPDTVKPLSRPSMAGFVRE